MTKFPLHVEEIECCHCRGKGRVGILGLRQCPVCDGKGERSIVVPDDPNAAEGVRLNAILGIGPRDIGAIFGRVF